MSKLILPILILLLFLDYSCTDNKKTQKRHLFSTKKDFNFNCVFEKYIDSFSLILNEYKDVNNIAPIAYIVIETADNDSIFKIRMECLYDEKLIKELQFDASFKTEQIHFLINYNLSNLVNLKSKSLKTNILKLSKITNYQAADTKFPTWLILIKNNKVIKINKNASSKFSKFKESCAEFTNSGIVEYQLDEWGNKIVIPKR